MESALSMTTTTTLLTISKILYLHCQFSATRPIQSQFSRRIVNRNLHSLRGFTSITSSLSLLRSLSAVVVHPVRSRLQCVLSSAASFASGGGVGGIGGVGSGGSSRGSGGDGALEEKASTVVDVFESSCDIILDVGVNYL